MYYLEIAVKLVTIVSLPAIIITIYIARKQLFLSTISKCIDEFRKVVYDKTTCDEERTKKYIELCNEQLLYIRNNYIPFDIAVEWIDGMIDYLPVINKDREILNLENIKDKDEYFDFLEDDKISLKKENFNDYKMLQSFLTVDIQIDGERKISNEEPSMRKKVISKMMLSNLNYVFFNKCYVKCVIRDYFNNR